MADVFDGAWRLFSHDPATGRQVWVIHEPGATHWRVDYPVENVIRANSEASNDASGTRWGDWARIASVPLNVYYDRLADPAKQGDQRYIAKFLNDSDNRAWRTREGRV